MNMRCPRCEGFSKDVSHLIVECLWSKLVWGKLLMLIYRSA